MIYHIILWILIALIGLFSLLVLYLKSSPLLITKFKNVKGKYYQISIMLGSGGHTGQLTHMLQNFNFQKASKVNIIITAGDNFSKAFFQNMIKSSNQEIFQFFFISRTNQVKQSYKSSIFTTIKAFFETLTLIRNKLINTTHFISNGPGSCVPYFVLFKLFSFLKITNTLLIFIQSWCRVQSISLTGKIVRFLATKFIVHWEKQHSNYKWTDYYGKII